MESKKVVIDSDSENEESNSNSQGSSSDSCRVCGADNAAMHYGAVSCVGCKGFFRRALMKADQLECPANGNCIVSRSQKIQCRSCRFQKCLREGMKPAFVRPNRDLPPKPRKPPTVLTCDLSDKGKTTKTREEWMKKMTVEMRTILMTLLNIEIKIMKGDTNEHASQLYPLKDHDKLRELIEDPSKLKGKRTEMRYEPYRMAANDELCAIAYRRLIAAIDWIENLSPLLGHLTVSDKIALVKNAFAPLMVFNFAARTAEVAKDKDILCLCNFAFVPRNISKMYQDAYHLGNGLVERALEELVEPYRAYGMREEEIVCVNAMLCLNPLARDISEELFDKIVELRNRISDCLFAIVKEVRLSPHPNVCFGHILLSLPTVSALASAMCENLQFAQTFSVQGEVALLTDLFGCFTVEPFFKQLDEANQMSSLSLDKSDRKDTATQTDRIPPPRARLKRRITAEDEEMPYRQTFRLLQPPTNFYITEILDDLKNNPEEKMLEQLAFDASSIPPSSSTHQPSTSASASTSTSTNGNVVSTQYSRSANVAPFTNQPSTSYNPNLNLNPNQIQISDHSNYPPLNAGYVPNVNYQQLYQPTYQQYLNRPEQAQYRPEGYPQATYPGPYPQYSPAFQNNFRAS